MTTSQDVETETAIKIGEWVYEDIKGTWSFTNQEIEIYVSIWCHEQHDSAYMLCVRWNYKGKSYATYLKVKVDEEEEKQKKLLVHAAGFVTNWVAEQNETPPVPPKEKTSKKK